MIWEKTKGIVFDIQRFAVHDGPGIRTLVFFKGCPLRCQWCANPESINPNPELAFIKSLCNSCGKCRVACPREAVSIDTNGRPSIDRKLCDNCGQCLEVCFPRALILYGQEQSAAEVFAEVEQDMIFYSSSQGGMTLSGGEPLSQPSFASSIFTLCHRRGIHTAIETSGFAPSNVFREILALADHILFDLKCMDTKVHEQICGRTNSLILENARILANSGKPFNFRVPLVPGLNDTQENLTALGLFLKGLSLPSCEVELLPYHRLGTTKYDYLDREYGLREIIPQTSTEIQSTKTFLEKFGVHCVINV